ncbi:hypothetical protein ACHAPM_011511 [Fusarium culmorum]
MDMDGESDNNNNEGVEPEGNHDEGAESDGDGPSHEEGDNAEGTDDESDGHRSSYEERDGNETTDDESEGEFQGPAPRSTTRKREQWKEIETEASEDAETIDQEALYGFGTNAKTGCETVGRTTRDRFINAYGDKQHRIYKLEDFPHYGCVVKNVKVINDEGKQLGMKKDGKNWVYTRRHVAGVYGIAFQDDVIAKRYGPSALDPDLHSDRPWMTTYIWVGWRDPKDQNIVQRSWETRTTARRIWGKKTDMMIFNGACEADMRYNSTGQRVMSRDGTPGLIQEYIARQREESVAFDVPRQPSVPVESITPSIETDSIQNRPNRPGVRNQRSQATTSFNNQVTGQREIIQYLETMQQSLMQLMRQLRL